MLKKRLATQISNSIDEESWISCKNTAASLASLNLKFSIESLQKHYLVNMDGSMAELPPVKLFENEQQRSHFDSLADLYSLVVVIDKLENCFIRDTIAADLYEKEMTKLLAQFRTLRESIVSSPLPSGVSQLDSFVDIDSFVARFQIPARLAVKRIKDGVPATVCDCNPQDIPSH